MFQPPLNAVIQVSVFCTNSFALITSGTSVGTWGLSCGSGPFYGPPRQLARLTQITNSAGLFEEPNVEEFCVFSDFKVIIHERNKKQQEVDEGVLPDSLFVCKCSTIIPPPQDLSACCSSLYLASIMISFSKREWNSRTQQSRRPQSPQVVKNGRTQFYHSTKTTKLDEGKFSTNDPNMHWSTHTLHQCFRVLIWSVIILCWSYSAVWAL